MEQWKIYKLGELYDVQNGLSKGGTFFGSGFPFLSFKTVFNNYFIPTRIYDLVQSTPAERERFSVKRGDIFITRTSETSDELGMSCVSLHDIKDVKKVPGAKIEVYIRAINEKNKTLVLNIFNPNLDRSEKVFFSADKVFKEIDEEDNKEQYFDCYFNTDEEESFKLKQDLVGQYNGESNLWLFTYMNILDTIVIGTCIRKHQIEELAAVCKIMIKLQEWMVEGSTFLDLFSEEKKSTTITKSTAQIQKFNRILLAIDIVRKAEQNKYINDIVTSIQKSGRIAIRREERIEVMINILRIYPEYLTQDIDTTCQLVQALLNIESGITKYEIDFMASKLNYYIEADVRKMRHGTIRSNEIDTTQTLLINEVIGLLCINVMIYTSANYADELEARTCKARFFRFLSFVSPVEKQSAMIKAGVDALVGVLDGSNIFTWDNAANIDPTILCDLTAQATVLDCNTENDFYYLKPKGKTGIIRLDPTGFTFVPYKQCATSFKMNSEFIDSIKVMHHLETLPIKLGTMFNASPLNMDRDAVKQYLLWRAVTKHPEELDCGQSLSNPQLGDKVRVIVKEQNQPDKLKYMLFVRVIDKRFQSVDGILTPKDISSKWIEDSRKLFMTGQTFYAEVCNVTSDGKYQFSIRNDVERYATPISRVEDDVTHILEKQESIDKLNMLSKSFIQELILLVDMLIRKEIDPTNRLTLIGYAYCICALTSDPKSYYHDFLLRYYAAIEKFITNKYKDINIDFHDTINSAFVNVENKRRLVELLSYANNEDEGGLKALQTLANEDANNDVGKLAAMLISYIFAQKANFSIETVARIKNEINNYVGNSDKLDLSTLSTDEEKIGENSDKEMPEDVSQETQEIVKESHEETTPTKRHDIVKSSIIHKPLKVNILNNGNVVVTDVTTTSDNQNAVVEISIPTYAPDGEVILVNNDGAISIIKVSDIVNVELDTEYESKINPYKLSNHFVVPTNCFIGSVITSNTDKYVEIYDTNSIPDSELKNPIFTKNIDFPITRLQPFILPNNCLVSDIKDCIGKCVKGNAIPVNMIEEMKSYGIFI